MSTRDLSSAQEKKLAEELNGKLTPNSGGTPEKRRSDTQKNFWKR